MIKSLYENEWLSLRQIVDPEKGISGYTYSHETRCNGQVVAVLPYMRRREDGPPLAFLLRYEVCPAWGLEHLPCAITGGMDKPGKSPLYIANLELAEEAGIHNVPPERWAPLGACRGTKSTDTVYHLFAVDVTDLPEEKPQGDGSRLEAEAYCRWDIDPTLSVDPLVPTMAMRLDQRLMFPG